MKLADRQLCFDFLMKVTRRSKEEAQQFLFTLGKIERARLLDNAMEWRAMGRPEREERQDVQEVADSHQVSTSLADEDKAPAARSPARKKEKKVLFSLLLPPAELEALRALSDESGETVSFHVRQAIRSYLRGLSNE